MSGDVPFRTLPEELTALTKEIAEIRSLLRDLGLRLGQIERHAKRAFGVKAAPSWKPRRASPRPPAEPPTMSAEDALRFFDGLVAASREQEGPVAQQRLEELGVGDLRVLAQELGLPGGTKPSKRALVASILGRVKESVMLSRNINVTEPRSTTPSGSSEGSSQIT